MFQTPEGMCSVPLYLYLEMTSPAAEAIDQWFEQFQNYEATLVRLILYFVVGDSVIDDLSRKIWRRRHWMSTSRRN